MSTFEYEVVARTTQIQTHKRPNERTNGRTKARPNTKPKRFTALSSSPQAGSIKWISPINVEHRIGTDNDSYGVYTCVLLYNKPHT